ncbi:MAG: hypothetical protein RBR53_08935 [Desulforegulaceae bacterium]|nr:hypothetical protein [Desulforegulaceae bacterium]
MHKMIFVLKNFLFIFHLGLGTRHFGVNNKLWSKDSSIFSVPFYKGILTFPGRIRMMKKRAFMGFMPFNEAKRLFPLYAKKNYRNDYK